MAEETKRQYGKGIFEKYRGVWYARWADAAGRWHVQKAGTKATALQLARRRKDEALRGRLFPENLRKGVKFADLAADALKQAAREGRLPGNLAIIKGWFPDRNVADLVAEDIDREFDQLRARGLAPATVNHYKSALSVVFKLAVRNRKALANPARQVKQAKENNERTRYLNQPPDTGEETRLRAAIRERWPEREPELDLALQTGMRKGEQYSLRWADVDLIHRVLTIPKAKGNKKRYIDLNETAVATLAALRKLDDGSGFVCPGGMGNAGYWATRFWFDRALAAAHINDFRWHDLRHTFASRLRMKGVELATIKELLGHTTINMVLRYAHLAPGYTKKAVDLLVEPKEPEGTSEQAPPEKVIVQ
jgi:integrase